MTPVEGETATMWRRRSAFARSGELWAVLGAGAIHVLLELVVSETVAFAWSATAAVALGVYLVHRARRTPGLRRAWGFRSDNFVPSLPFHLGFALVGCTGLVAWGAMTGSAAVPATFWLTLALYPLWGMAQQFALQNLVAGNLAARVRHPVGLAAIGASLFAASHFPRMDLLWLTLLAGFPFILLFRKAPNLWAVGLAHGMLGTCAAYYILREDPGAVIRGWLG